MLDIDLVLVILPSPDAFGETLWVAIIKRGGSYKHSLQIAD